MSRPSRPSLFWLISMLCFAILLAAPVWTAAYTIELDLTWNGSGYLVEMRVEDPGGAPEWVGYDIRRQTYVECDSEIILNEEILPRNSGEPTSHALVDADILDNTLYGYQILFVDAARQPIGLCDIFDCEVNPFVGWYSQNCAQRGVAPLVAGTIEWLGFPMFFEPCPQTCGLQFFVTNDFELLEPYAGTGQAIQVFGTVNCQDCGPEGCVTAALTSVIPVSCVVAAPSQTWGCLKSAYR